MIPAAELASLRDQEEQGFSATAIVLHKVTVEDSQGGTVDTYPTEGATSYPCSFARYNITPVEREAQPRIQSIGTWQFLFAVDADIRDTDRLVVGSRTFEVVGAGVGSADLAQRVICMEIR